MLFHAILSRPWKADIVSFLVNEKNIYIDINEKKKIVVNHGGVKENYTTAKTYFRIVAGKGIIDIVRTTLRNIKSK